MDSIRRVGGCQRGVLLQREKNVPKHQLFTAAMEQGKQTPEVEKKVASIQIQENVHGWCGQAETDHVLRIKSGLNVARNMVYLAKEMYST